MSRTRLNLFGVGLVLTLVACSSASRNDDVAEKQKDQKTDHAASTGADNTARNVADRNNALPTPMDQGTSELDMNITTAIRQAIVDTDWLSLEAKNVKIITNGGVVVLRGAVKDGREKQFIQETAERIAGVSKVDNLLESATYN